MVYYNTNIIYMLYCVLIIIIVKMQYINITLNSLEELNKFIIYIILMVNILIL